MCIHFFEMQGFTPSKFVGLENYINIVTNSQFFRVLGNTLQYVGWSLVIGFPLPIILAIMVNEMVHKQSVFRFGIYMPIIIPAVASAMIWYFMYYPDEAGLLNTLLSNFGLEPYEWLQDGKRTILYIVISSTWHGYGGTMILYLAALTGVNQELYEAAIIDGAGIIRRVFHITIPQISSMILLGFVKQIISIFQILDAPMTMTGGGPNGASMSIAYWAYKEGFEGFRIGSSLAISTITFVILIFMTIFYFALNKRVEDNNA